MAAVFAALEQLPRQNASRVKNKWGDVVRQVQSEGSVAVTNHSKVEMVLVDAAVYERMVKEMQARQGHEQHVLQALDQRFDERLAALQQPGAAAQVGSLFAAGGKLRTRPKAGTSY
ncbi:MAG: type II toxin-antitoxin system prevent-host-death family antitoxin [Pseudorhodoferax sp.]